MNEEELMMAAMMGQDPAMGGGAPPEMGMDPAMMDPAMSGMPPEMGMDPSMGMGMGMPMDEDAELMMLLQAVMGKWQGEESQLAGEKGALIDLLMQLAQAPAPMDPSMMAMPPMSPDSMPPMGM